MNVEILDDNITSKDDTILEVNSKEYLPVNKQDGFIDRINTSTDYDTDNTSLNEDSKRGVLLETNGETIFGRDIKTVKPVCIGNVYAFWYVKNQPMIVIGPHCI
jgi:hypothetical protein